MPSRETVKQFIETVERGETVQAIEAYYADDASMQENSDAPRSGKQKLVAYEQAMLAHVQEVRGRAESWMVDGDRVAIHWRFNGTFKNGKSFELDEIAYQEWERDKIKRERFFYDPR